MYWYRASKSLPFKAAIAVSRACALELSFLYRVSGSHASVRCRAARLFSDQILGSHRRRYSARAATGAQNQPKQSAHIERLTKPVRSERDLSMFVKIRLGKPQT